ncbi:MAG TPA: hypothetical protein DCW29_24025 [Janthinobacterium sp.]|nr:hypothetical protein [Janthinobacterium sp.]
MKYSCKIVVQTSEYFLLAAATSVVAAIGLSWLSSRNSALRPATSSVAVHEGFHCACAADPIATRERKTTVAKLRCLKLHIFIVYFMGLLII